jgi:hypothetical protein
VVSSGMVRAAIRLAAQIAVLALPSLPLIMSH